MRHSPVVQDTSAATRRFGLRTLWDWEIADQPESLLRTRRPDGAYTSVFAGFAEPAFAAVELINRPLINRPLGASYAVYGTVGDGAVAAVPSASP